jgi:hypothetical protein
MITYFQLSLSVVIVVAGWFVNSFLNRRHEMAKKRMEYRLSALQSFIPVFLSMTASKQPFIDDPLLNEKFVKARVNFQLYGYMDEIDLIDDLCNAIDKRDIPNAEIALNSIINLVRNRIRDEINLSPYNQDVV